MLKKALEYTKTARQMTWLAVKFAFTFMYALMAALAIVTILALAAGIFPTLPP